MHSLEDFIQYTVGSGEMNRAEPRLETGPGGPEKGCFSWPLVGGHGVGVSQIRKIMKRRSASAEGGRGGSHLHK